MMPVYRIPAKDGKPEIELPELIVKRWTIYDDFIEVECQENEKLKEYKV